jgi:hypothetical protein
MTIGQTYSEVLTPREQQALLQAAIGSSLEGQYELLSI